MFKGVEIVIKFLELYVSGFFTWLGLTILGVMVCATIIDLWRILITAIFKRGEK